MRSRSANGFIVHENYNRVTMANDIGLVAASLPLQLASFSKRIVIMKNPPHVDWGYVAGWGVVNDQSEVAQALKFTKQKLQSPKICQKIGKLPVGSFCAGPVHGTGSPDRGDSGSALIINKYVQIVNCVSKNDNRVVWICGASIINQKILLTAGHCVEGCTKSSDITINVGSTNKNNGFATTAHSFIIHENYNKEGAADIGMIKSRVTLKLSSKISRISLLKNPPFFLVAQLAGWGLINEVGPEYSPMLKSLNQRVWTNIECIKILGNMPPGTLCAGSLSSRDYAAPGDSGSALLIQNYIQIGLVSYKLLLTAAHCVEGCRQSSVITINVGNANNNKGFATTARSFLFHENYVASGEEFDIGLIKTRAILKFSARVSRVALLKQPQYKEVAQLAGWGVIDESRDLVSPLLKSIDQKVWNRKNCIKLLGNLPAGTLCASSHSSYDYAAPGDSGSALLIRGYIQIGLVSYKVPSVSRSLIVYTDVAYYYNWIKKHTKTLYCG
ncbi:hypothetical protein K1T71_002810 [Dendrolimus kikuchii]|uniref:Uncharacterized protein n=1 Tax=Dendrolimus kikuchii TaxID=765133 RepID=A0ACC1DDR6_9NEOP|nr:hypothetical protein K1T71_002810 [Dendrolimus kikuchii]